MDKINKFLTLSEAAANHVKKILEGSESKALRIGLKKGGCAGMEYTMEFVKEISANDEVIAVNGAKVVIAPTAQMFLFGTEIDYEQGVLESGFKFSNPNVSETCGCGESIKFDAN
jgi:iron-sulfur cluster assembly protein